MSEKVIVAESSEPEKRKIPAVGNQIIREIKVFPGEGLIIRWIRDDFLDTEIEDVGPQKPMYDFVVKRFPEAKNAAGEGLYIVSDENGYPLEIGQIGGGEHAKLIEEKKVP